jgi:acetylornithine deacetylase
MINSVPYQYYDDAVKLLQQLIQIPSLSRQEADTATCIEQFLKVKNIAYSRVKNNIWCANKYFDTTKPTVLLNSHHDTVPANAGYTNNPYDATIENDTLYGLGSTDAGASLVSLFAAFLYYYDTPNLNYNIVFAATAEEEISGSDGIEMLFASEQFASLFLHKNSFAIVGEPTQLQLAIAEKGLLVLDCEVLGLAGHAARNEGVNAITKATKIINWINEYNFEKVSPLLGAVKATVTSIATDNKAHNVVPASCTFVVDIRLNELYTHQEIIDIFSENIDATITARSTRLKSTTIDMQHSIVLAGVALGKNVYGSPTMSDKALIPLPTLKCGVGNSAQSHTANEFVALCDIEQGISFYIALLNKVLV